MRSRLRRFVAVSLVVTSLDVAVAVGGRQLLGAPILVTDSIAIVVAATLSWFLNRSFTYRNDPRARWVREPGAYVRAAGLTGVIDVAVMRLVVELLLPETLGRLMVAKLAAVAVAAIVRVVVYRAVLFQVVRSSQRSVTSRGDPQGSVRLSVVVPAFREEQRIGETVTELRAALASVGEIEIVVVDDGSGDATADVARRAGADVVIALEHNRGKGGAVRAGVLASSGRTVAFTDADLSYPPAQLIGLMAEVEAGWDVVVGSRRHVETATLVHARRLREVSGRVFNLLTLAVLLGQYRDTQCGLKAFRADVAQLLFSHTRIDGFAFDVELFHLIERYRLTLHEVPVSVANAESSTVRVGVDALRMIGDLARLRRLAFTDAYDLTADEAAALA